MHFEEINEKLFVIKVLSCFYFSSDENGSSVFHNRPLNLAERHRQQSRRNLGGKCTPHPPRFQQQQQQNIFQLHDFMYYCLPLRFSELPTTLTSKSELMGGKKVSYLNCCRDFSTCSSKQEGFWTFLIQSIDKYNTCSLTIFMMILQNPNL